MNLNNVNFIDLFCGCGGFSLGLKQAGLNELGAIDFNPEAIKVFKANFPETKVVIQKDLTVFEPNEFEKLIGTNRIDIVVGGPPCQGFSTVRQRDGSNSGDRIIFDKRRELYQEFLKYVEYFKPKMFIMENVLGIRSAAGGHFFNNVQSEGRTLGYRVHSEIIRAWEYGVPQKRERQLIIGTRLDLPLFNKQQFLPKTHSKLPEPSLKKIVTLGEAIDDLPELDAGQGLESITYDLGKRDEYLKKYSGIYLYEILEVNHAKRLTSHYARPHNPRDLRDFQRLYEGETSAKAISRGEKMEFPYDRATFKDRYTRQNSEGLCSTIVAHLSKDGLMFIHPRQNRSLTPRESARIQTFPDWFEFPVARTNQFKLIGNAVPPVIAKAVGTGIINWIETFSINSNVDATSINNFPIKNFDLVLTELSQKKNGDLSKINTRDFLEIWYSISYFFFHLHPDSAYENGKLICDQGDDNLKLLNNNFAKTNQPFFVRSGWPVSLVPFAQEAQKRLVNNTLSLDQYYCSTIRINGYHDFIRGKNDDNSEAGNNSRRK